jgi:hypothetical protein
LQLKLASPTRTDISQPTFDLVEKKAWFLLSGPPLIEVVNERDKNGSAGNRQQIVIGFVGSHLVQSSEALSLIKKNISACSYAT